jgi:hypothetical protein
VQFGIVSRPGFWARSQTISFIKRLADALVSRVLSERVPTAKRLFTLAEAAEYIGRSPKAVEHLIQRGAIPVTKLDGKAAS